LYFYKANSKQSPYCVEPLHAAKKSASQILNPSW